MPQCRRPTIQELWDHRSPLSATKKAHILRTVATLQLLRAKTEGMTELYESVTIMLFDYIMLAYIDARQKFYKPELERSFPGLSTLFKRLGEALRAESPQAYVSQEWHRPNG